MNVLTKIPGAGDVVLNQREARALDAYLSRHVADADVKHRVHVAAHPEEHYDVDLFTSADYVPGWEQE